MKIIERAYQDVDRRALIDAGIHPLLARIYAARRIRSAAELAYSAAGLLAPPLFKGIGWAAALLPDAIPAGKRLLSYPQHHAVMTPPRARCQLSLASSHPTRNNIPPTH